MKSLTKGLDSAFSVGTRKRKTICPVLILVLPVLRMAWTVWDFFVYW